VSAQGSTSAAAMAVDTPEAHLAHTASAQGSTSAMEVDTPEVNEGTPIDLPPQNPPPSFTQSGRPRQEYRLPKRFRDNIPEPPAPVPTAIPPHPDPIRRVILIVRDRLTTVMNSFGIWRDYPNRNSLLEHFTPFSIPRCSCTRNSRSCTISTDNPSNIISTFPEKEFDHP
jgi:hypothetical protein